MLMKSGKLAPNMIDVVIDDGLAGVSFAAPSDSPDQSDFHFTMPEHIEAAVSAACASAGFAAQDIELCVRFASDSSVNALNLQWRDQDKVTDVLSFPMQSAPIDLSEPLGDIALAVPFVLHEAARLHVPSDAHCLHLIIHATLHLLGFDHIDDNDARSMQMLEQQAMQRLGLHDPYPVMETE